MLNQLTTPSRTLGSLGPVKINQEAYTDDQTQLDADEYNAGADNLIEIWNATKAIENGVTTMLWRPTATTTPEDAVYGTADDLLLAAALVKGHLKIILDPSLSTTFNVPAGAYALLCRELTIQSGQPNLTVTFLDGVT